MKVGRTRTLQSAKYLEKKRKKMIVNISILTSIFLLSIIAVILVLRVPFLQIKNIEVVGTETISSEDIVKNISQSMEGEYIYVIPKTSVLFYPKSLVYENLLESFPKIDTIESEIVGTSKIKFSIKEKLPSVVVCEGFREDESSSPCYFSDKTGYIYEKVDHLFDGVYFKYYLNTSSTTLTVGSNFIEKDRFNKLQEFVRNISDTIVPSTGILIGDDGSYELYIQNKDLSTAVVYFDERTSFEKTLQNLSVFLENAKSKKIGVGNIPNFEYINLRFGNNVFYLIRPDEKQ